MIKLTEIGNTIYIKGMVVSRVEEMYVRLILRGQRCFEEVPKEIKDRVKELLIELGRDDLIEV